MADRERDPQFSQIVGESPAMRATLSMAERAAQSDANVCIVGENGTGKELIARAIHYRGARRGRPLITLDCAAIPEGLMESQLFGHVKGAFTGAIQTQDGIFSLANTGTLFLDEIGELSHFLQAKLLRVIQFREFTMVGGTQPRRVDVRFVAATNKDLRRAVSEGTFRADLYYRIGVVHIVLPPLRDRREDIPPLAAHFVSKFAAQHQKPVTQITPRSLKFFLDYDWPGNVRELENCIEQGVIFSQGEHLDVDDLRVFFDLKATAREETASLPEPANGFLGRSLRELEEWHIQETLKKFGGNRTQTARILGISLRGLQYKLKRCGMSVQAECRSA